MSWVTVYIRGRKNFQKEVLAKLEQSWLAGSHEVNNDLLMFWIEDTSRLRSLKKTIGCKLIFKYRLHFFTDLDLHLKAEKRQSTEFSREDSRIVRSKPENLIGAHRYSLSASRNQDFLFDRSLLFSAKKIKT